MRRLVAAAILAAALLLLMPLHAAATSRARIDAALAMAHEVGHHGLRGPAIDRLLVLQAWQNAGVDLRGLDSTDALLRACTLLDASAPRPTGPAPGDYALYRESDGTERVGMFLSQLDVAVVDGDAVVAVPSPELDGSVGVLAQERLPRQRGSLRACRLNALRWPGGTDDVSITRGRIALADPAEVARQLQWAALHPRDADPGFWHPIQRILASLAAVLTGAVSSLIDAVVSGIGAVLRWIGDHDPDPVLHAFLFALGLLGRGFDGRRLHAVLTGVVIAVLAVALGVGWLLPFGWVIVGAVLGGAAASAAGVPVLGAIGGALVGASLAVASFLVGAFTGVDDSANVTVGSVVFALVADVFVLPRAIGLTSIAATVERLPVIGGVVGHGRSALDLAGTAGDALALRPDAILRTAHDIDHGIDALRGTATSLLSDAEAVPVHHAMGTAEALMSGSRRSLDLLSLAWRPSSISSDLVGHAADALHLLDTELRSGLPSLPKLRALLIGMDPATRAPLLDAVTHVSTHAVPELRVLARLSHLHSGARTVMGVATHDQPRRPWVRLAQSPIVRRWLHGLPEAAR